MTDFQKALPAEMHSFEGGLGGLLDQIGGGDIAFVCKATGPRPVSDLDSLRKFLKEYASAFLYSVELPAICQAYYHAARYESRELHTLDQQLTSNARMQCYANPSSIIGRTQLLNLRPLRENRLVQRYIAAVEAGEVRAWHMLVYGISLSIYSVPLRQGLLLYSHLVLDGFARSSTVRLSISDGDLRRIVQEIASESPQQIDSLLNSRENPFRVT